MAPNSSPKTRSGSCICGAITVKLNGDPQKVGYCFCKTCSSMSGCIGQYAALFDSSAVEIFDPKGQEGTYADNNTASGKPHNYHFCGNCSVVYASVLMVDGVSITAVRPSALDIENWQGEFIPEYAIYTDNRCKWADKLATL